jgi:hypothetical protein
MTMTEKYCLVVQNVLLELECKHGADANSALYYT